MMKVLYWGLMLLACIVCPLWVFVLAGLWWVYKQLY